jgi:cytochrome c-type biogenesis protein
VNGPGALVLAFGAGLLSFLSPCTLPLLPGYLAYMSGLSLDEVQSQEHRGTALTAAGLFVLGFSLVFVALGATASYIGSLMSQYRLELMRISGVFIILMALVLIGMIRLPILYQEKRFHVGRELGLWSAFPLGMAFAFGWTPCIGPTLGAILAVGVQAATVQRGALLLFCYALGLGVPFLLAGLFAERVFSSLGWFKRHFNAITMTGSAVLMVMGVFLLLGQWTQLLSPLITWYGQLNLPV